MHVCLPFCFLLAGILLSCKNLGFRCPCGFRRCFSSVSHYWKITFRGHLWKGSQSRHNTKADRIIHTWMWVYHCLVLRVIKSPLSQSHAIITKDGAGVSPKRFFFGSKKQYKYLHQQRDRDIGRCALLWMVAAFHLHRVADDKWYWMYLLGPACFEANWELIIIIEAS